MKDKNLLIFPGRTYHRIDQMDRKKIISIILIIKETSKIKIIILN
jgi:hypothetical protein